MQNNDLLLYKQIEKEIYNLIIDESIKPGQLLYSENKLCELFNVSRQTVRKTLNELFKNGIIIKIRGKGTFISQDLNIDKIRALININERTLEEKKIAIMTPDMDTFFFEVIKVIDKRSSEFGYTPHFYINDTLENENEAINKILASGADGVIFTPFRSGGYSSAENYYRIQQAGIPTVIIGKPPVNLRSDSVYVDDISEVVNALSLIAQLGYKSAIHITNRFHDIEAVVERSQGYEMAISDSFQNMKEGIIIDMSCDAWADQLSNAIRKLTLPCVLFVDTDLIAYPVYNVVEKMGLKIPDEIGLMGYDNLTKVVVLPIGLTSVQPPYQKMAEQAFELMHNKILKRQTKNGFYKHYIFESELIIRGSVMDFNK